MSARPDRLHIYKADDGWRWRYVSSNGKILAHGGQGYSRRIDAIKGASRVVGTHILGPGFTRYDAPVRVEIES